MDYTHLDILEIFCLEKNKLLLKPLGVSKTYTIIIKVTMN